MIDVQRNDKTKGKEKSNEPGQATDTEKMNEIKQ